MKLLQIIPVEQWKKIVIAYDNMCHLNGLRVAKKALPLPSPYDQMWISVTKVYI